MTTISAFYGPHDFLSNFSESPVEYEGLLYPTVEHAFQAAKTHDPEERRAIQSAPTPDLAKRLGRRVLLRDDWERIKTDVMHVLLRQKFAQGELRQRLLDTGDAELIEGNTWGDKTWGCVRVGERWIGQNRLGKLLMQVRAELRATTSATAPR